MWVLPLELKPVVDPLVTNPTLAAPTSGWSPVTPVIQANLFAKPFLWSLCPYKDIFSGTGDRASCPPSTKQTVVQSPAFPVYMRKCSWARFRTLNWTSFYCPKTFMLGNLVILNWPWMWGRWIALSVSINSVLHNNRHIIYGPSWCSPTPTRRKKPTY